MNHQTVTVLGAGYVGLTTAALLSSAGYTVYIVEPNQERLSAIRKGRSFFYEQGLDPIIKSGVENKRLLPTSSYEDSVSKSSLIFSAVGTPDLPDGSSNLTYVLQAANQAAALMKPGSIFIQKSTVPVGTGRKIQDQFEKRVNNVSYVSNPEFLREGTALYDTLYFDRVVVGGDNTKANDEILSVYRNLESNRADIAKNAGVTPLARTGDYVSVSLESAELIKVTSNAFLALKISFSNSIALLSDSVGADIVEVMDAVGADERIGRAFLNAGRGYGGGCFPKDVSGLIASGHDHGVNLSIMQSVHDINLSMPAYVIEKLLTKVGTLEGKSVAVLGLSFKPGTSDARKSPGVTIANLLIEQGVRVKAFDPKAIEEARQLLHESVILTDSWQAASKGSDVIIVATAWDEFVSITAREYKDQSSGAVVFDAVNALDKSALQTGGVGYIGVGR